MIFQPEYETLERHALEALQLERLQAQIERLRQLPSLAGDHDRVDGRVRDSDLERCAYATAPAPGEIAGYGSSASWREQGARR